jgi:hypothetical protein
MGQFSFQRCYNEFMTPRVSLILKNAKDSEEGPEAFTQVLASLPHPNHHLLPFLTNLEPVSFEIICVDQTIYFQVNVPQPSAHYLISQLTAAYPHIAISHSSDTFHHLAVLSHHTASASLNLAGASYYPLKTFRDFSDLDPFSSVLGTLSKLPKDQAAVVQLLVTPDKDTWKRNGYNLAAGSVDSAGKHTPNPYKDVIDSKLKETCLRGGLKIAVSTPLATASQQLLTNLTGAFAIYTLPRGNSLKPKQPFLAMGNIPDSLKFRTLSHTPKQYFSVPELASLYHLPYDALKDIKNLSWGRTLLGEPPENLPIFLPDDPNKTGINFFAQTEFKNQAQTFGIKDLDRRRHIYVMGKTGTGKSTLLANMIINDLKHGKGLAVVDPHGDLVETVLNYIPSNRINDVIYLNPADTEYTVKLNLLEATDAEHKELVASGIIAIFQKLYGYSWGPRLEHILRNTLLTLITRDQSTLEDVIKMLVNPKFREKVIEKLPDQVLKNFWTDEFANMGDKLRAEAVSPILNKVGQFVSSPLIRNVINAPTNSFSFKEVMDQGKILLCNLSQGKLGEDNSALLGAMLITKIQLTSMGRVYMPEEQRRDFYLYVDEFQNFATTSFIKILSEARKYHLNLVLANQYIDQIDDQVRKAIFGNCGTIVTFIVGAQDAGLLSLEFGKHYTPENLVALDRHQIVMKLSIDNMTSTPFPAYTLPLAASTNTYKEKVIKVSRERYSRKRTPTTQVLNND